MIADQGANERLMEPSALHATDDARSFSGFHDMMPPETAVRKATFPDHGSAESFITKYTSPSDVMRCATRRGCGPPPTTDIVGGSAAPANIPMPAATAARVVPNRNLVISLEPFLDCFRHAHEDDLLGIHEKAHAAVADHRRLQAGAECGNEVERDERRFSLRTICTCWTDRVTSATAPSANGRPSGPGQFCSASWRTPSAPSKAVRGEAGSRRPARRRRRR